MNIIFFNLPLQQNFYNKIYITLDPKMQKSQGSFISKFFGLGSKKESQNEHKSTIPLNIILLGQQNVGKTASLNRYINDKNPMADFPHGLNLYDRVKEINREGYHISLKIWDTAQLQKYRIVIANFLDSFLFPKLCIIFYSVSDPQTFEEVDNLVQLWKENQQRPSQGRSVVIVANKVDCQKYGERKISTAQGIAIAKKHQALYIQSYSQSDIHVSSIFNKSIALKLSQLGLINPKMDNHPSQKQQVIELLKLLNSREVQYQILDPMKNMMKEISIILKELNEKIKIYPIQKLCKSICEVKYLANQIKKKKDEIKIIQFIKNNHIDCVDSKEIDINFTKNIQQQNLSLISKLIEQLKSKIKILQIEQNNCQKPFLPQVIELSMKLKATFNDLFQKFNLLSFSQQSQQNISNNPNIKNRKPQTTQFKQYKLLMINLVIQIKDIIDKSSNNVEIIEKFSQNLDEQLNKCKKMRKQETEIERQVANSSMNENLFTLLAFYLSNELQTQSQKNIETKENLHQFVKQINNSRQQIQKDLLQQNQNPILDNLQICQKFIIKLNERIYQMKKTKNQLQSQLQVLLHNDDLLFKNWQVQKERYIQYLKKEGKYKK